MKAVILAAGRGMRMEQQTAEQPKCLLQLAGKSLLQWQIEALTASGITDILVVRGYLKEKLHPELYPWFAKSMVLDNPQWSYSNMVRTLLVSFPYLDTADILVSYADIVYHPEHIQALMAAEGAICLTYDTQWESLWRLRQEHPLNDVETFQVLEGKLIEIGKTPQCIEDIQGQYMGLLKLTTSGRNIITRFLEDVPEHAIDQLDMTTLLQKLLMIPTHISAVPVVGKWCECDTYNDMLQYEKMLSQGGWSHDWRS